MLEVMSGYLTVPLFLGGLGGWEILVIAFIILLIFGGRKIPELMKGLGKGVKNFKEGMREGDEADNTADRQKKIDGSDRQSDANIKE